MTEAFGLDSFTPDRDAVTQVPATVTLRWAVRGAACVVLSDHGPVQGMAQDVEVHATTTFVLTAYAADLAAVDAKSVTITAPEPAASPEIPKGVIATWHGDPRRIPPGWTLCDGRGDTPDLRDRFVLGADAEFPLGKQGDGDRHTHAVTFSVAGHTDGHGRHGHALPWTVERAAKAPGRFSLPPFRHVVDGVGAARDAQLADSDAPAHGLAVPGPSGVVTSKADPPEPPWHALCYIMRTPGQHDAE